MMMSPRVAGYLAEAVLLLGALPLCSGQAVGVEVQNVRATPYKRGEPLLWGYRLEFDIRITTTLKDSSSLPSTPTTGSRLSSSVTAIGAEYRQTDGTWKNLFQSTWLGLETTKYEPCSQAPAGATVEIKDARASLL